VQLLLTDRLTCPRCGPTFGLILLANRMVERRVLDGTLGCPNCRDSFPIVDGFADLRAPPRGALEPGLAGEEGPAGTARERAGPEGTAAAKPVSTVTGAEGEEVVALLGIQRGPGTVALVGRPARHAPTLVASVEELDVVVVDADARSWAERPGVSRLVARPGLPFFDRTLRGVVVDGRLGPATIYEAARVTAPLSRVVALHAAREAADVLREAGLEVLAQEGETVVAARG
jgi:uncharacterized protein YbaR (Trm112 family)